MLVEPCLHVGILGQEAVVHLADRGDVLFRLGIINLFRASLSFRYIVSAPLGGLQIALAIDDFLLGNRENKKMKLKCVARNVHTC